MTDTYTKAILTLIAIALLLLAGQNFNYTKSAKAQPADCGDFRNPCRVLVCSVRLPMGGGYDC